MPKRSTKEEFEEKANKVHNGKYDYSKVVYINTETKVIIICPIHGEFKQRPHGHLDGDGCSKCSGHERYTYERVAQFLNSINITLLSEKYKGVSDKLTYKCNIDGYKWTTAFGNLKTGGNRCPKCAGHVSFTYDEVVQFLKERNITLISKEYKNTHGILIFKCNIDGHEWKTSFHSIKDMKTGCPKCITRVSRKSTKWLNNLNIKLREYKIYYNGEDKHPCNVDGFEKETNTVFEYLGDFWHGNPVCKRNNYNEKDKELAKKRFAKTLKKFKILYALGYEIFYRWEMEDGDRIFNGKELEY